MKTTLCTLALLAGALSSTHSAWSADADTREETLYTQGTRAINDGRWQEAQSLFASVVTQHGQHAEAALYWEAYALNKQGKQEEALRTCAQLEQTYPHGRWIDECGALEIEIRGKSDDPLPPQQEQNEELKLLALNSLMQQDPARALPIIQQILTSDKSDKLKTRALFVLAQDPSPQAQEIVGQTARNDHDPNLQRKAVQMLAISHGKQAAPTLAEVYRRTSNEQVKKAILQTYLMIGTPDPLIEAAQHESNQDLVRTAVQTLGAMGATSQLATLYRNTSNPQTKADILNGLIPSGPKGAETLASISSSEQDPSLRVRAIRNLGAAGGPSIAPSLVAMYRKNPDVETKKAIVQALFFTGDSHDLVGLARAEKDPAAKKEIVQQLSMMRSKEATDYMLEILNK